MGVREESGGLRLGWRLIEERRAREGAYLLRTNREGQSAEELWTKYVQLTEAEAAFRALKSERAVPRGIGPFGGEPLQLALLVSGHQVDPCVGIAVVELDDFALDRRLLLFVVFGGERMVRGNRHARGQGGKQGGEPDTLHPLI